MSVVPQLLAQASQERVPAWVRSGLGPWLLVLSLVGCSGEASTGQVEVPDAASIVDTHEPTCPTLQTLCDGRCVDLSSDQSACGSCGNACDADERCLGGTCLCLAGTVDCDGRCVDLGTDLAHCGACGDACGVNEACVEGACVSTCEAGTTACGTTCVDLATDLSHCGACDTACIAGANASILCVDGQCERACEPNHYDLDSAVGCEYYCAPAAPGAEVCDGEDNDCDGLVDDADPDATPQACPNQAGVCAGSERRCSDPACGDAAYRAHALANGARHQSDELGLCDGEDNDCDGEIDEGCCGFDVTIPLVPTANPTWANTRFAAAVTRATRTGPAWLVHAVSGDGETGWIGALEPGDTLTEAWRVPGVATRGEAFDVQATDSGASLDWVVLDDAGVVRGTTDLRGAPVVPFATVAWPGTPPIDGAIVDVAVTAARDTYAVTERVDDERRRLHVLHEVEGAWAAWTSDAFDVVGPVTLLRSDLGVRACATTADAEIPVLRCWQFDAAHDNAAQVVLRPVPRIQTTVASAADGAGVSLFYGDGSVDCMGACMIPLLRTTLGQDGSIETTDTGLIAAYGIVHAGVGANGELWLTVYQLQTLDRDTIIGTFELRRASGRSFERVARFTNVQAPFVAGPLFDETRLWAAVATSPGEAPAFDAGWVLIPFAHDGTALCGPHLP